MGLLYLILVLFPVFLILALLLASIVYYFKRDSMVYEHVGHEQDADVPMQIEATGVKSHSAKKAKRQEEKQKYKDYKKYIVEQQKREEYRQEMLLREKRHEESRMTKFDDEWFNETNAARKLIELEMEIKGNMNDVVNYMQSKDIVFLEELEILFFYTKAEITKIVDNWISKGVILASRDEEMITMLEY